MKTLSDLIKELQDLYDKHGNLSVVKQEDILVDCPEPKAGKVWTELGYMVTYDEERIAELRSAMAPIAEDTVKQSYDIHVKTCQDADIVFPHTLEEWRKILLSAPVDAAETVRRYEEAPFMVII